MANKNIPIRNVGSKGVISDLAPYDTPSEAWSDCKNIRFNDGKATKIGGSLPVFYKNPKNDIPPEQIPLHIVQKPLSDESWFWATKDSVWETNGWNHLKVVKEGTAIQADNNNMWSSAVIANSVILSTLAMDPIGKSPDISEFQRLKNWGPWKAQVVRSYKNFALALNLVEGGFTYSQRVRWSNIVPPNSLPADWGWKYDDDKGEPIIPVPVTPEFIKGSAGGYNDLTMAVGNILDGAELKDQFMIYTDKEVMALDYVGGNEIFRARKIFSDAGIINTDCVAIFDNKHFVISDGDIYVHNGSSKQSIVSGKIKDRLIGELTENSPNSIKVLTYEPKKEIWVFYAGSDSVGVKEESGAVDGNSIKEATKAAVYNWLYDTWSFVDIPRALDVKFGPVPNYDKAGVKIETWATLDDTEHWDDSLKLWGGIGKDFKNQALLVASADGHFYSMDQGDLNITLDEDNVTLHSSQITASLTKNYMDLDQVGADIVGYKHILGIYPQINGTGDFYFRVGGSHQASGSIEWGPRESYVSGADYKVDVRSNYRYLSIQVDNMTEGSWDFTGYDLIVRAGGRR